MARSNSLRYLLPTTLGFLGLLTLKANSWATDADSSDSASQMTAQTTTSVSVEAPELNVEEYQLENGLSILLSQDHTLPFVSTEVVYLVGSSYEQKGRTGFAHLFEHLMFQGSENYNQEYFTPLEPIGAKVNGTTNRDRTNYYELVPKQYQELSLWLESDRMRSLLPALTQEKLDNQRDVVKNERRQRYENQPYGMAWWYLSEALYPPGHPYRHTPIGSHEDLSAASLEDVKAFFETYYVPANAALVIVGDFDKEKTKADIEKYFGDMPSGERAPAPQAAEPQLTGISHWTIEDKVTLPRIYLAWPTPPLYAKGDAELDLLSSVLATGKTSRLFKELVYDKKVASSIHAFQMSMKLSSSYIVEVTAAPGTQVEELYSSTISALEKALAEKPSAQQLQRARNSFKKSFFRQLESYSSRASLIGNYFLHQGRGDYLQADFERYEKASSEDVIQAGRSYLTLDRFVRIDILPGNPQAEVKKSFQEAEKPVPPPLSSDKQATQQASDSSQGKK
ncbi:MAG: insulinase family protein [Polyangiaceae bacterium]|nr:insulinase family protein [Polyangiaceae bacterium]